MPNIGDSERKTQNRVVKFFRDKLHYTYLGNLHDSENRNIMQERLHTWLLKQGYSEKLASNAVNTLVKTATNLQQGLIPRQQRGLRSAEIRCQGQGVRGAVSQDGIFY